MTNDIFTVNDETGWPTTRLLPSPANPMAVARELVDVDRIADTAKHWRGDFYRWQGTYWRVWPAADVKTWLYRCTEHAVYRAANSSAPWAPNRSRIGDLTEALAHGVLHRDADLDAADGRGAVAFANGVLDLTTMDLTPHSPDRFNLHALHVDYDPDATCGLWLKFLNAALEGDAERIAILQEWFGYILCGGTELQKILSMVGPKRCGKGTILRIIAALLGERYVASPSSLDSLTGNFGCEKLIAARLAVLTDIQWTGARVGEALGVLLAVSGEDYQTIARKHRSDWSGYLPTRFMLAGNDPPKFRNPSGALASRMIHLRFRKSMYGREDKQLTAKLMRELAGIFNWALTGWRRLQASGGCFTVSAMEQKAAEESERQSSPVTAFARDCCVVEDGAQVDLDELYKEYDRWRAMESLIGDIGKPTFSQHLQSAFPMVTVDRSGSARSNNRRRTVIGIRLREVDEADGSKSGPDPGPDPDPTLAVDLHEVVSAGQRDRGPGGPGGPDLLQEIAVDGETSYERMRFSEVDRPIGNLPGPVGSAPRNRALTCINTGPDPAEGVGSANPATWSDLWDGLDLEDIEPDEAA